MGQTPTGTGPDAGPDAAAPEPPRPLLRVVRGDATPEEIAALVAVVTALGSGDEPAPRRPRPAWSDPRRGLRRSLPHGPGGWRTSSLPR